jgi:hypothetical protein
MKTDPPFALGDLVSVEKGFKHVDKGVIDFIDECYSVMRIDPKVLEEGRNPARLLIFPHDYDKVEIVTKEYENPSQLQKRKRFSNP